MRRKVIEHNETIKCEILWESIEMSRIREPRFAVKERDYPYEMDKDEAAEIIIEALRTMIKFLEKCKKRGLTLEKAIELLKEEYSTEG
jgi:hypothetical protein